MEALLITDDLVEKVHLYAQKALWKDLLLEFENAVQALGGVKTNNRAETSVNDVQLDEIGARIILARTKHISPGFLKTDDSLQRDISEKYARQFALIIFEALAEQGKHFSFPVIKEDPKSIASRAIQGYDDSRCVDFLRRLR